MEFCIISPIAGLERYSTLSRTHLLLPQIYNQKYWDFYDGRRKAGDTIILDNGAYEGHSDWNRLLACIRFIKPHIVSLPDYLCQPWEKTWHAADQFLDSYFYEFEDVEWMFIPQSDPGNILGFVDGLYTALEDERIKHIGLPRALAYRITQDVYMRVRVAEQIKKRSNVGIHALGMVNGNVNELRALRESGCVRSCDSNAPVWRGWCGWSMVRSHTPWKEIPINYEAPEPPMNTSIIENLGVCGVNTNVRTRAGSTTQG